MSLTTAVRKRSGYLAAGTGLLLLVGIVYAWSILSAPLGEAFGWNSRDLSLNFTIMMSFFCLSGILGGLLCGSSESPARRSTGPSAWECGPSREIASTSGASASGMGGGSGKTASGSTKKWTARISR